MSTKTLENKVDSFFKSEYVQFFRVIAHNEKLFLVDDEFKKAEYLNLKEKVLEVYLLFGVIDANLKNPLLEKLMKDIINLVFFFDELDFDVDALWEKFSASEFAEDIGFEEFKKVQLKLVREYKIRVSKVTTTRLYLFDCILWKEANQSRQIGRYLRNIGLSWVDNTKEFLEKSTFNELPCIDIRKFFTNDKVLFPVYSSEELETINSVINGSFFKFEENELLDRVIKAKKGFRFFSSLDDDDIRHVVKDLRFLTFKRHELVIKEGDEGEDIYLLIDGDCRVTAGKNVVGAINKGQIFGEFSPVTKELRTATVRVNSIEAKVLTFKIAFEKFDEEPRIFANLYKNIVESMIAKLDTANKRA